MDDIRRFLVSVSVSLIGSFVAVTVSARDRAEARSVTARDVASWAGISRTVNTAGENCVFDYDGDGVEDLFLSNHAEAPWQLYRGQPDGRFVETNIGLFPRRDRHGCATADFNGDGRPDIYASIGACVGTCTAPKELWIQTPQGTFVDRADQFGVTDPGGRGREPIALDANGDTWPDLFTGQAASVKNPSPNRLWVNVGGGGFVNPPGLPTEEIGEQCVTAGDFDGDGYDELIVCGGRVAGNAFRVYDNTRGRWSIANAKVGVPAYGRSDAELVDLNRDGRLDLVTVTAARLEVKLNRSGRFQTADYTLALSSGRDLAVGDANGDGDQDIYVLQGANATVSDLLLLNRGLGASFARASGVPQATTGEGDTVQAIPGWKGTSRTAFLVNNGFESAPGPRQLIFEFTKCMGVIVKRVGTSGRDKLKGTKKKDGILGLGGNDRLRGKKGKDGLCGGRGKDKLNGGRGNDKLHGGPGRDKLIGGPGRDKLIGGPGRDKLIGGPGRDKLIGGPGRDKLKQ